MGDDSGVPDGGNDSGSLDAGNDSGPPDAATRDGAVPTCQSREALFCDGFEGPNPDRALPPWSYATGSGMTTVTERTNERAYEGERSLHAAIPSSSNSNAMYASDSPTLAAGSDTWFRARYFLPATFAVTNQMEVTRYANLFGLLINTSEVSLFSHVPGQKQRYAAPYTFPRDQWVCIEIHVIMNATIGEIGLYADGVQILAEDELNTQPAEANGLLVGFVYSESTGPAEIFIDDIVVDDERVGCN